MSFLSAFYEEEMVPNGVQFDGYSQDELDRNLMGPDGDLDDQFTGYEDEIYGDDMENIGESEQAPEGMAAFSQDPEEFDYYDDNDDAAPNNDNGVIDSDHYDDEIAPETVPETADEDDANINDPELEAESESFFSDDFDDLW